MKLIGLIGGTTWFSTADYYRFINEGIHNKLEGNEFAHCILYSFNFGDLYRNNLKNDWEANYVLIKQVATHLKDSGAKAILLCANTLHMFADRLETDINLPVIHIAKATASAIKSKGLKKVALLGTKFTMEMDFFKDKLKEQGIETIIPTEEERTYIHSTIFDELGKGLIKAETKKKYLDMIDGLVKQGAQGIILGCTEIPLLIKQEDCPTPLFDTTLIHSQAAVAFSLGL
jgi:aspartate racemase